MSDLAIAYIDSTINAVGGIIGIVLYNSPKVQVLYKKKWFLVVSIILLISAIINIIQAEWNHFN